MSKPLPQKNINESVIGEDDEGIRLDRWFRRHSPGVTQSHLEKLLRKGQIRLSGRRATAGERLKKGDIVRVPPLFKKGEEPLKPVPRPIPQKEIAELRNLLLYRDDDILAINKPSGLAVQGGTKLVRHLDGLLDALRFDAPERPKLTHRLDKDASGVLLLARSTQSAAALTALFRQRKVQKIYWALTLGTPRKKQGSIMTGMASPLKDAPEQKDKRARTEYAVIQRAGQSFAWIALMPITGRKHQLRIHMAEIGTPLLGDKKYRHHYQRGETPRHRQGLGKGLHLHAREISLKLPSGKNLHLKAPLPPHMEESWRILDFDLKGSMWENSAVVFEGEG